MLIPSVLVCVALMVVVVGGQTWGNRGNDDENLPDCVGIYSTYTRSRSRCHERAVCADVWDTIRDWNNGTRCRDRRVMFNCRCPDNRECPVFNPDHVLFANIKQSHYTCEPACELQRCRTRVRPAKELVRNRNPRIYPYYRINCRCADHHEPLPSLRGRLNRATKYLRLQFDFSSGQTYTQYGCKRVMGAADDPCMQ